MTRRDPEKFRKQAEQCRLMASVHKQKEEKEFWLRLEKDWLKLAEAAERKSRLSRMILTVRHRYRAITRSGSGQ
jgi:hypothetical protein